MMKKESIMLKSLLASFFLLSNAYAFDYKINIESRIDLKHQKNVQESDVNAPISDKANFFEGSLVRINFMGNINEELSYRVRFRVNANGSSSARDKTASSLDHAYIDHKNRYFTTRLGKTFFSESFGRESMVTSTDLFIRTEAYQRYNRFLGTYKIGASAIYSIASDQKIILSITNPNPEISDTSGDKNNTSLGYGLFYSANFFNNYFQPIISLQFAPQDADKEANETKADFHLIAAGFKSQISDDLSFEIDWKEMQKEKATTTATKYDGKTRSLYSVTNYNINEFTPFVGYVYDKFNADLAEEKFNRHSYVVGAKWKPFADLNFRYHLYYTHAKTKFDERLTGIKEEKEQVYAFGFKADI